MAKESISITGQPDHFIDDVVCPFCKKPTLGVVQVGYIEDTDYAKYRYAVTCMHSDCVLNFISQVSFELDDVVKNLFKGTEYDKSASTD